MAEQIKKHHVTPEELSKEIAARAHGETALVMITITQWKVITEAYHSPLMENIANTALTVIPMRDVGTKKLSFMVTAREFQR